MFSNETEDGKLSKGDSMNTYFKDSNLPVLVSKPNYRNLRAQEIVARSHFNQVNFSKSVTDNDGGYFYKHQNRPSGNMVINDSIFLVHGPGTGKTYTQIKVAMDLLVARIVSSIIFINLSENGNTVAIKTFETIFKDYYSGYFESFTFAQFRRKFINEITTSKIASFNYPKNSVVIIDEAHNLLSDNENHKTKKTDVLEKFVKQISGIKGMKIVLSTATPLFGDESSIMKFRQIMLRNFHETKNEIPEMMISFIKVNYSHLNINFMTNGEYPHEKGDFSFVMKDGKKYNFNLFVQKPTKEQLADFFNLNYKGDNVDKDRFQTYVKPLIVASEMRDGKNKSAIVDSIVKLIETTNDGTVVIYTDILKKGASEIARILDTYGFEKYSEKANNKEISSAGYQVDEELVRKIRALSREIDREEEKLTGATHEKLEAYKRDFEEFCTIEDNHEPFKNFILEYEEKVKKDIESLIKIDELIAEQKIIEEKILSQMRTGNKVKTRKSYKYIVYTSGMSADDKKAFDVFNSPKNWDGSIIKVIIFSRIGRDGIDVKHVLQTHIVIPEWRIPGLIQAQHRGIRNNSHRELIRHRAIAYKRDLEKQGISISLDEAKDHIETNRIDIQIYHHLMDFSLLDIHDVEEALPFMVNEGIEEFNNDPSLILEFMQSDDNEHKAGRKIYDAAIEHHINVGPAFTKLVSSSYDLFCNVHKDDRLEFAITEDDEKYFSRNMQEEELFGKGDTELFFIDDYVTNIIKEIKEMLTEKSMINTDEIIDHFLNKNHNLTVSIVVEAIIKLTNSGYIYNPKFGINMMVKLWETENESILFLDSSRDNKNHPSASIVTEIPISFSLISERIKTTIEKEDLEFPKNSQVLVKLKDLLERALYPDYILTVNEITFLTQMSNFWSFSWNELEEKKSYQNINVYVFLSHITSPDINILAKDIAVGEYNLITKKWKTLKTGNLKNILFIRSASLVNMYRNFDYYSIPELAMKYKSRNEFSTSDFNGIVFVKGFFNPNDSKKNRIERLLANDDVIPEPMLKNVVVKSYADPSSKGCQISSIFKNGTSKENIVAYLKSIAEKDVSMFFFLYDKSQYKAGQKLTIFDIKDREKRIMTECINGRPSERYQIVAIENLNITPERKQEIYMSVFDTRCRSN